MWIWWICITTLVSLASSTEKKDNFRLPHNLVPRHYSLRLLPNILDGDNANVRGFVQIDVNCIRTTTTVTLHAVDIKVELESVKIYDRASREQFSVLNITENISNQFLIFHLRRKALVTGANYVISMNFVSRLNNEERNRGFYRLNYMEEGQPRLMLLTQLQPIHARQVFPCFDEPNLKADFTITVGRPANMISVSNMPIFKTMPAQEYPGYEWDFFHRSFPMSTYIVSVAILDSPSWMYMKSKNTNLRIWARPSLLNQTKDPLEVTSKMLDFYQNYLEVDFPLPKQDMIAAPGLDSAMENWGLIIYGERFLTHKDEITSSSEKELNALVMAHEMAHQWFGNLVTIDWWTDIWLNEGLATYLSYIGVDKVFPEFKMGQQFMLNEMQKVMYDDALVTTHSVYKPIEEAEQILWVFNPISYKKSSSLLQMLAGFLGEKTFKQGLKRYLLDLQYKNAVQNDLWAALTRQAIINKVSLPYDIKSVMETWTHHVGYPVVTIERNYSARTATAVQTRFLLHEKNYDNKNGHLWFIPLSFVSPSKTVRTVWLPPLTRAENITDLNINANQWLIMNVNRTGFYRVNYDERNWNLIWAQLLHDPFQIPIVNRAQLLDDAFNLARADHLPYGTPFNVANYLRKETEYIPWKSAFEAFQYIDSMLLRTPTYEAFKFFMIGIMTPMYDRVTFFQRPGEDLLTNRLRSEAVKWTCQWNQPDCLNNSLTIYKTWMKQPNDSIVPADLKRVITCTAVRNIGFSAWEFAWAKFQQSNIHTEKSDLLSGMGCSTNTSLLSTMLNWTLNSTQLADIYFGDVIISISSSVTGKTIIVDFIRANWEALKTRYGPVVGRIGKVMESIASSFNNVSDLELLKSLKLEYGRNDPQAEMLITYLCQLTETNILWMSKHYQQIDEWLHQLL